MGKLEVSVGRREPMEKFTRKNKRIPVALNFLIGGEAGYIREFLIK